MARRSHLPSDPAFLLEYMQDLPVESDSDGEFDGYLEADDGANGDTHDEAATTPLRRSHSLDILQAVDEAASLPESPLAGASPSLSPMQGESSSGSPLACRDRPTSSPSPSSALSATTDSSGTASEVGFCIKKTTVHNSS